MMKLDLHGFPHSEVINICHEFINQHWDTSQELHIITGHSDVMKEMVKNVLREYDVVYHIGDFKNPGYIKVWV